MAKRFFTADFHLGFDALSKLEKWPFADIAEHDRYLLDACGRLASPEDTIIHVGDLASYGYDGGNRGLTVNPMSLIAGIDANFVNVRGNHDNSNRVKSVADSIQTRLGRRFPQVTVGHYPSYDPRAAEYVRDGWINVCGHVHGAWRHCLDLDRRILNVNVGCMVWRFEPVSEDDLIKYVNKVLSYKPNEVFRCRTVDGKTVFYGKEKKEAK